MTRVGDRFELGPMVAYIGNTDCTNLRCRRSSDGSPGCMDYHCPRCHEPCPMYGHEDCQKQDPRLDEVA